MANLKLLLLISASIIFLIGCVYLQHVLSDNGLDYGQEKNFKIPTDEMKLIGSQYSQNGGNLMYRYSRDYKTVSTPWNPKCIQRPYALLQPATYEDARDALMLYKKYNQSFTIMSGGHDFECESNTNNTVLHLGHLNKIEVDLERKEAKVQAGARWADVYEALNGTGYEIIGGMCPTVGVGGFTLGGGFHWRLSHYWGSAAQNVKKAVVVLASGEIVTATRDNEYQDLMWGLMGAGGGNFGLVLQFIFQIHPYPEKYFNLFSLVYVFVPNDPNYKNYDDLIDTAVAWKNKLEEFLNKEGYSGGSVTLKREDPTKNYQIMSVDGLCKSCDFEKDFADILRSFPPYATTSMNQQLTTYEYEQILDQLMGDYPSTLRTNNPGAFLAVLSDSQLSTFLTQYLAQAYIGYQLEITLFGDMVKNKERSSFPYSQAKWKFAQTLLWEKPQDTATLYYLTGLWNEIVKNSLGTDYLGPYINYDDLTIPDYQKAYFGDNLSRLIQVKDKYDPDGLFKRLLGVPLE